MIRAALIILIATSLLLPMPGCQSWNPLPSADDSPDKAGASSDKTSGSQAAKACIVTAQELHQEGHYVEAAKLLEKARSEQPNGYDYARHLAVLYDELGMTNEAENEFRTALANHPKDADLQNDFGYYCFRIGDDARAEQQFRKALELNPKHQHAQTNLARTLFRQNRLEEAHAAFVQAVGPAIAHQNMGVLLAQAGRDDQARMAFEDALQLDPNLDTSREFLAGLDHLPQLAAQQRSQPQRNLSR
ncbi:tetratricopeptide repeat protein [Blastopirellula marina]|nr:tetratricopeptide repeat protein [Blastopirellula marina]